MKLREDEVRLPSPEGDIRTIVIGPAAGGRWPGVLLYTDIFQLTESTLRTARRLASYGFVVVVPEIYPHGELAGAALEFDDAGKAAGQGGAAARRYGRAYCIWIHRAPASPDSVSMAASRRRLWCRSALSPFRRWRSPGCR